VIQARELRDVYFSSEGDALVANAEHALVTIRLDGREPLASAPFGEPGDQAGPVSSDGEVAWALRLPDDRLPRQERKALASLAYDPDDGRSTLTIPGAVFLYGTGDAWLYTLQNDGRDAVIDSRSGAIQSTGDPLDLFLNDPRASMILEASSDGQDIDVRRLPDLSPIETGLGSFGGDVVTGALSTDGRRIAVATVEPSGTMLHVRDVASGDELIEPIPVPNEGAAAWLGSAFTPDDRTLLIGDHDGGIAEIDVATGRVLPSRIEGMHGPVVWLWPLADGLLLAVSHDGTMSIYDLPSGQRVGAPMVWAPLVYPGFYSLPTSDLAVHFVLAPDQQGLRLWNVDPSSWPAVACQRAGRNLTADEWARFMPADEPYRLTCPEFPAV
jgi:WD40 repeat protein